jgi:hypothetical protein
LLSHSARAMSSISSSLYRTSGDRGSRRAERLRLSKETYPVALDPPAASLLASGAGSDR